MKKLLLLFFIPLLAFPSYSTHLAGGTIQIICVGGGQFNVRLIKYRDPGGTSMSGGTVTITGAGTFITTLFSVNTNLPQPITYPCLTPPPNSSLEEYIYQTSSITLSGGQTYTVYHSQNNRNSTNTIPPQVPMLLYAQIPDPGIYGCNNSPVFQENPPMAVCLNESINYDGSAVDPDGDSLEYRLCNALTGTNPPFSNAPYAAPYSGSYPVQANPPLAMNANTGFVTGTPTLIGAYNGRWTFNYCVDEYRGGVKIGEYNREVQMTVTTCIPFSANIGTDYSSIALGMDVIASCDDYEVTFDNVSNGGSTFFWDFGVPGIDTDTSSQFEPTYTYPDTGTYQVKLVLDAGSLCADSIMRTVIVYPTVTSDFSYSQIACAAEPISFMDQSSMSYGFPIYWSWKFGDGGTSGQQHPSHTYGTSGNYEGQLMFESSKGCRDTVNKIVQVSNPPTIGTGGNKVICAGNSAQFNVSGGLQYSWAPPTGLSCTSCPNPTASPDTTTTYTVTATNANGCTSQETILVIVNQPPTVSAGPDKLLCGNTGTQLNGSVTNASSAYTVNWSPDSSIGCSFCVTTTASPSSTTEYIMTVTTTAGCVVKDTVTVEVSPVNINMGADTSVCGTQHILDIGNPSGNILWSTGAQTPQITVMNSGTYSVTVSDGTCTLTDSIDVDLNPIPTLSLGSDTALCPGEELLLVGNVSGTYHWSNGATADSISVQMAGVYAATVTDANGCSDDDSVLVDLLPAPIPDLGPDTALCGGQHVLDGGNPAASVLWSTGEQSQQITVTSSGNYYITATDGVCTIEDSIGVTLNPIPKLSLGPNQGICPGDSALLVGDVYGSYVWSTGATADTIFAEAGTYSATVTDLNGCIDDDTVYVDVLPVPTDILGPDVTACDSVKLHASGGIVYVWQDGSFGATHNAQETGTYAVTATDTNGCSATEEVNVTINESPFADFSFDTTGCPIVLYTNLSSGTGPSYLWDFGDSSGTSSDANPWHSYGSNGLYMVKLTASNSCDTNSVIDTIGIDCYPNGITKSEVSGWEIYPNPATTFLYLRADAALMHDVEISIVNAIGNRVWYKSFNQGLSPLDIRHLPAGIYFLEFLHNGERQVLPISIIR